MLRILLHSFLTNLTRLSHLIYFRRYKNHYAHSLPKNASIIFAANHQNSFMDAIALIGGQNSRPIWLTRANMFKTSIARFWLHALHMLPIYRTRDGLRAVSKNKEIIQECIRLLNEDKLPIGIFPEGNHNLRYTLRPLQKGIARIAFDAADQSEDPGLLYIVPCGFTYSDHTRFRSDLLVLFGEPIPVEPLYQQWKESPGVGIKNLLQKVRENLSEVMIDIRPENYIEVYNTWQRNKPHHTNLYKEFLLDKDLIKTIESGKFIEPEKKSKTFSNALFAILGFPLFLLGFINNFLVWAIMSLVVNKLVTDEHFIAPIRCYVGLIVLPLIYIIQGTIVNLFVPYWWWTAIYLVAILILGQFAGDYYNRFFSTSKGGEKIPDPVG